MAGYENIEDYGFDKRTAEERREIAIRAGKASGKARRRKAALRDTMNRLLTMQCEVEGLSDVLKADDGNSTYEEIISMAIIRQVLDIETNGGLNGKEIDEGNASSVSYLSAQIRRPLSGMRREGLRYLARQPRRAIYGK